MKKHFLFMIFILSLIFIDNCWAQTTTENEINKIFRDCEKIVCAPEEINDISYTQSHVALEYAIEIIKKAPDSLESYYVVNTFKYMKFNDKCMKIYSALKNKYYDQLGDITTDLPEKLILANLLLVTANTKGLEEIKRDDNKCYDFIVKVKKECQDKRYTAIATQMLFYTKDEEENQKYFLSNFPTHPAIYIVELSRIQNYVFNNDPEKCLTEINKWIPKYKDCLTPFGWLAIMHAYHTMIVCYVKMNDFENAKKYYDIIEKEAPNYPDLNTIKNFVDQKTIIDK